MFITTVRSQLRELIRWEDVPRNGAVFFTRVGADTVEAFRRRLAGEHVTAKTLMDTRAGIWLGELSNGRLGTVLAPNGANWNEWKYAADGTHESLNGIWRELSAWFALKAAGEVHVLLGDQRIPDAAITHWQAQKTSGRNLPIALDGLRTFGFVELPILLGMIGSNRAVTEVCFYDANLRLVDKRQPTTL